MFIEHAKGFDLRRKYHRAFMSVDVALTCRLDEESLWKIIRPLASSLPIETISEIFDDLALDEVLAEKSIVNIYDTVAKLTDKLQKAFTKLDA